MGEVSFQVLVLGPGGDLSQNGLILEMANSRDWGLSQTGEVLREG